MAGLSNRQLVQMGVVQCPERRYLFDYMTVKDNLMLGTYNAPKDSAITPRDVSTRKRPAGRCVIRSAATPSCTCSPSARPSA
jgi:hypothetical protein